MSHSQFSVLFLLTVSSFSIFGCKEYNQSDFSIDHLAMSMCRIICCAVGRGCFSTTSAFSWQNCQPLPCFLLYSKAKFACYSRYLLTSYICIPVPYDEKDIFFGSQFYKVLQVLHRTVQLPHHYWLGHRLELL